jgi:hypothetical protein
MSTGKHKCDVGFRVAAITGVIIGIFLSLIEALCAKQAGAAERFVKVDRTGIELTREAGDWQCVYDTKTGLLWEKGGFLFTMDWKFANTLNKTSCGRTDWRLPTVGELKTLVACRVESGVVGVENGYPCIEYENSVSKVIDPRFFPTVGLRRTDNGIESRFWASETQDVLNNTAWVLDFSKGSAIAISKKESVDTLYVVRYAPKVQMCEYPTWDAATDTLTIPKFEPNPLISSIVLQIDLKQDTFTIKNYR